MCAYGKKQARKITGGKYHWELQDWVNQLFIENDKCLICGSKDYLEPHHVIQVKPYDKFYTDVNNGVVLCKSCHRKYHEKYGDDVNSTTLLKFALQENRGDGNSAKLKKKLKQSKKVIKYYKNENLRLQEQLDGD